MQNIKHAFIVLIRLYQRSLLLLGIGIVLGGLLGFFLFITRSIQSVERNLWLQLPPVVTIAFDDERLRNETQSLNLTSTQFIQYKFEALHAASQIDTREIQSVLTLPEVFSYEYLINIGFGLTAALTSNRYSNVLFEEIPLSAYDFPLNPNLQEFSLTGVSKADFSYLANGVISLNSGLGFHPEDFNSSVSGTMPVILSQELAQQNNWDIGSVFSLSYKIQNINTWGDEAFLTLENVATIGEKEIYFEIVGIFEYYEHSTGNGQLDLNRRLDFTNLILTPSPVVWNLIGFKDSIYQEYFEAPGISWTSFYNESLMDSTIITLKHPSYFPSFLQTANEILHPYFLTLRSASTFNDLIGALSFFRWYSVHLFWGSVAAIFLILNLLILLSLHERRNEIAIYLALGEKKKNIIFRILLETLPIFILALIIAFLLIHLISHDLSHIVLRDHLLSLQEFQYGMDTHIINSFIFSYWEIGEMVDQFYISFSRMDVASYFLVSIGCFIVATIVPLLWFVNNPHLKARA